MCGIAGIFDSRARADLGRLAHMSRLMRHRGPDDEGFVLVDAATGGWRTHGGPDTPLEAYRSGAAYAPGRSSGVASDAAWHVALLHRRLAIVDLSPGGHQPMSAAYGRHWLTFNGEIYNFIELRDELRALGHEFVTTSDTEVILAAYRQWSEDCLSHFNGMFALALWDQDRGVLFCARDRLGVKPFYYQYDGTRFAFASEPKALVLTQDTRPVPRPAAIRDLLALDWVDHGAHTFFEGLMQLPPAHCLRVGEGGIAIRRWWGLDERAYASGTSDEFAARYAELFTDSVRLRLRADVEVGSCLSGGLDSSAVVTTAGRLENRGLHAFSCAYDEGPAFDERPHIRAAVESSGAKSHLTIPNGDDFWSVFDTLATAQDEPTAGPGVYSQWKVMELAHATGLKVLLDGQGGDETLAGYFRYLPSRLRDLARAGDVGGFLRLWGPVSDKLGVSTALLHTFEPWLPSALVAELRGRFGQGKDRVLSHALRGLPTDVPKWPNVERSDVWRHLAFDTLVRQLPSLLRYEDRNSMAFSIETRLPFLDYRLLEFAFSLPDEEKLAGATTKAILRRALGDRVPKSVLARRDKMGFETPTDLWFRTRFADEARRRLARPGPFQDWVDGEFVRAQLEEYLVGGRAIGLQVWRWLSLEAWSRAFVALDPRVGEREVPHSERAGLHVSRVEFDAARMR
ncbi:MAG: asparagine synthase (glutamine-hydrolyzing) [Candidatus Eisenbacteria bacterium]